MKLVFLVLLVACVTGCNPPPLAKSPASSSDRSTAASSDSELATVKNVESSLDESQLPQTADQLGKLFVEKYNSNPESAFVDLFDWDEMPQLARRQMLNGLLTLAYSKNRKETYPLVHSATKIVEIVAHCNELSLTVDEFNEGRAVPISHVLEIEMKYPGGSTAYTTLSIGQRDGVFYFYSDN